MNFIKISLSIYCIVLATGTSLFAVSPWLPEKKHGNISTSYSHEESRRIYGANGARGARLAYPFDTKLYLTHIEYAFANEFAVDVTTGYARSTFTPTSSPISGTYDTNLGVRWRLLDEFTRPDVPWIITATLRAAWNIEGNYSVIDRVPHSPGRGASGGEISLLLGKTFGATGLSANAEIGARYSGSGVPDEKFGSFNLNWSPCRWFFVSAGVKADRSNSGLDLGPMLAGRFHKLKERTDAALFSFGFNFAKRCTFSLYGLEVYGGKNIGDKSTRGASFTYAF